MAEAVEKEATRGRGRPLLDAVGVANGGDGSNKSISQGGSKGSKTDLRAGWGAIDDGKPKVWVCRRY